MRYASASAFRGAIETRLLRDSRENDRDLARLRRLVAFERFLVRLALREPNPWILKGGVALEFRLADRARATRDIDLAMRANLDDERTLRDELAESLAEDPQGDLFEFRLESLGLLSIVDERGAVWRVRVDARLDGRTFERIVVDVVGSGDDLVHTELLQLPSTLEFAGLEPVSIETVDRCQHFAEKLHAFTRTYGDRPNTRVKDLADLILLIDDGLEPGAELHTTAAVVFTARSAGALPDVLPDPPAGWDARYVELVENLHLSARSVDAAMATLRAFWAETLAATEER
jgi:hypothetical protein